MSSLGVQKTNGVYECGNGHSKEELRTKHQCLDKMPQSLAAMC